MKHRKQRAQMIRKHKKWIFYGLYTTAAALFFLYYLFPSDTIEAYMVSSVRKLQPDATLSIGRVAPAFPPGIRATDVVFSGGDPFELQLEHVNITPRYRSLFGPDPAFSIRGRSYDGRITGNAVLDGDRMLRTLHAELADMKIESMGAVQELSGRTISGRLAGTIDVERMDRDLRLTADLIASDVRIGVEIPGVNLKELTFAQANARLTAADASEIRLESLTAKGSQVNGNLSGTVRLTAPRIKSGLDLSGSVKPHPSFISEMGSSVALLFQHRGGNNTFPFIIKGTIEAPEFRLR